jgi:serine protease SohB
VAIDLVAASGGYLMACIADKILAAPFAVVGSIGVFAQIPNFNKVLKKYDVEIEQHTAGEYKTTLTMLGKNTPQARQKFQEELQDTHELFKAFVTEHRPSVDIAHVATGEHWYGQQAIHLNLVDELLTSDEYLLQKYQESNTDIFEISYAIPETLSDKLHGFLDRAAKMVWNGIHHLKQPFKY